MATRTASVPWMGAFHSLRLYEDHPGVDRPAVSPSADRVWVRPDRLLLLLSPPKRNTALHIAINEKSPIMLGATNDLRDVDLLLPAQSSVCHSVMVYPQTKPGHHYSQLPGAEPRETAPGSLVSLNYRLGK